jgi:peptidoglycan/xylan/chitin deacetylase (PgdA/CDA1 family)
MYHEVTDDPTSSGLQRQSALPYKHTRAAFAAHLGQIAAAPAAPTLVRDIDLATGGRYLLLTFDDGGASASYIADELERRGWKGHFFIITSRIGTAGFLDAAGIRDLQTRGHFIGSHSHTHPTIFGRHPYDTIVAEWRVSCDRLAQLLGTPCVAGAVPGGDISAHALEASNAAGLRYLFTSEPWLVPRRSGDCWTLGRFGVKASTAASRVGELAQFRGWWRALLVRQATVLVRRSLPALYRSYVQRRTREPAGASL